MNADQTNMNTTPLIPCPFCGAAEHESTFHIKLHKFHGTAFAVRCDECLAQGPIRSTAEVAIAWWNTRTKTERPKPATPRPKLSPEDAATLHGVLADGQLLREIEGGMKP